MRIRHLVIFVALIILSSLVSGIIYGINSESVIDPNQLSINSFNYLNLIVLMLLFFSSLSLISVLFFTVYFCFDSISIGYFIALIYKQYKMSGILYYLIDILLRKGLYTVLLLYLFIISFSYTKKIFRNLTGNSADNIKRVFFPLLKKYLIIMCIALVNELFVYFIGSSILNYFSFML